MGKPCDMAEIRGYGSRGGCLSAQRFPGLHSQAAPLILPVTTRWPLTDREKPDRKPHRFWWLWNVSTRKSG